MPTSPYLTAEYETSVPNLFIAGELGGLALIKNAVNQGRECIDTDCAPSLPKSPPVRGSGDVYDVLIVGAGPAGISASLRAIENKLNYVTIERDEIGGTVAKYPRQKLVMTSPVEFPMYGKFKKLELSKENLLSFLEHHSPTSRLSAPHPGSCRTGSKRTRTVSSRSARKRPNTALTPSCSRWAGPEHPANSVFPVRNFPK